MRRTIFTVLLGIVQFLLVRFVVGTEKLTEEVAEKAGVRKRRDSMRRVEILTQRANSREEIGFGPGNAVVGSTRCGTDCAHCEGLWDGFACAHIGADRKKRMSEREAKSCESSSTLSAVTHRCSRSNLLCFL